MSRILKNQARCLNCHTLLWSRHFGDFRNCSCGQLEINGGNEVLIRRCRTDQWAELSVLEEDKHGRSGGQEGDRDDVPAGEVRDGRAGAPRPKAQRGRGAGRVREPETGGVPPG